VGAFAAALQPPNSGELGAIISRPQCIWSSHSSDEAELTLSADIVAKVCDYSSEAAASFVGTVLNIRSLGER
jgi:hypothetical protein